MDELSPYGAKANRRPWLQVGATAGVTDTEDEHILHVRRAGTRYSSGPWLNTASAPFLRLLAGWELPINVTCGAGTITRVRSRSSWQPGASSCGSPDPRETRPHRTAPLRLRDTTVFLRQPQFSAAPTIAPVCQYSARLRLPALGLEPERFQTAYGAAPPRRTARRHRFARLSALEDPR